jgi:hypothetical protein
VRTPVWIADESRWPIVVLYVEGGDGVAKPDADTLFAALERLVSRGERTALVIDLTHAVPDAARRRRFADYVRQRRPEIDRLLVASAIVARSTFHRGVVTAVLWVADVPREKMRVFATRQDALGWVEGVAAARP